MARSARYVGRRASARGPHLVLVAHARRRAVMNIGVPNVLALGLVLLAGTYLFRFVWNTVTLLTLLPLILLSGALSSIGGALYFAHVLDAKRRNTRNALRTAARPFTFSTPAAWQAVLTRSQWSQSTSQALPPLIPDSPEVSAAINELINLILRDFVDSWYQSISSSSSFPAAVANIIQERRLLEEVSMKHGLS